MFKSFIGQDRIKKELRAIIHGLKENDTTENLLFRGPAGCGKTMLARLFCYNLAGRRFSYQVIEDKIKITPNIRNLPVHIIDEVHMVTSFENFYEIMDSDSYTFVFCTTESGMLPDPFTSRCITMNFKEYTVDELNEILVKYGKELGFTITESTATMVAERSRGSPRVAKKYLKRIKFLIDKGYHSKTIPGITSAFQDIGIFKGGYTDIDRKYLKFLANADTASLKTISRAISIDEETLKNEIEPFLLDKGHISISNRGRTFLSWRNGELNDG